jgi:hypothetical protein
MASNTLTHNSAKTKAKDTTYPIRLKDTAYLQSGSKDTAYLELGL